MITEETSNGTSGNGAAKKMKKTELMELAQQATDSFIEAQKKLMDVAGKQINAQLKATGRTLEMIAPFAVNALPDLAREGVKTFVDTEKALIGTVTNGGTKTKAVGKADHRKHPGLHQREGDRYCGSRPRLRREVIGGVQLILTQPGSDRLHFARRAVARTAARHFAICVGAWRGN